MKLVLRIFTCCIMPSLLWAANLTINELPKHFSKILKDLLPDTPGNFVHDLATGENISGQFLIPHPIFLHQPRNMNKQASENLRQKRKKIASEIDAAALDAELTVLLNHAIRVEEEYRMGADSKNVEAPRLALQNLSAILPHNLAVLAERHVFYGLELAIIDQREIDKFESEKVENAFKDLVKEIQKNWVLMDSGEFFIKLLKKKPKCFRPKNDNLNREGDALYASLIEKLLRRIFLDDNFYFTVNDVDYRPKNIRGDYVIIQLRRESQHDFMSRSGFVTKKTARRRSLENVPAAPLPAAAAADVQRTPQKPLSAPNKRARRSPLGNLDPNVSGHNQ